MEASYDKTGISISGRDIKAKTRTDENGYYRLNFEVFDGEIEGDGHFDVEIKKTSDHYWPTSKIYAFRLYRENFRYDTTYLADYLIPKAAQISYDIDRLTTLEDDEELVEQMLNHFFLKHMFYFGYYIHYYFLFFSFVVFFL